MTYFLFLSVKSVSFFEVKSHKWPCETMKKMLTCSSRQVTSPFCDVYNQISRSFSVRAFDFSLSFLLLIIILHLLHLCHFLLARVSVGRSVFLFFSGHQILTNSFCSFFLSLSLIFLFSTFGGPWKCLKKFSFENLIFLKKCDAGVHHQWIHSVLWRISKVKDMCLTSLCWAHESLSWVRYVSIGHSTLLE